MEGKGKMVIKGIKSEMRKKKMEGEKEEERENGGKEKYIKEVMTET